MPDVGHRLEPAVGILGQAAPYDLLQRNRRLERTGSSRSTALRICAVESPVKARVPAISSYSTAPKLNTSDRASSGLALRLFGGHVRGRPHHIAGDRPRRAGVIAGEPRDTEVEQLGVRRSTLPNDHDIGRLQIAVKNAAFMRGVQCVGNLARQPHRFVSRNRTAERFPLEILEDEVVGSDVVDLANVWMVDCGDGARFTLKPAHIVSDHPLDRDSAIQAFIVRLVDLAHTSRADQRLDCRTGRAACRESGALVSVDSIPRAGAIAAVKSRRQFTLAICARHSNAVGTGEEPGQVKAVFDLHTGSG